MSLESIFKEFYRIVLDTGVLIAYLTGENETLCTILDDFVFAEHPTVELLGHDVLLTEIYYITCRSSGKDKALENVYKTKNIMTLVDTRALIENAGWIKCKYAIALPDCFSIATAMLNACPACFLKEIELSPTILEKITEDPSNTRIERRY
jgi:predicted nucleic acid-binding protein